MKMIKKPVSILLSLVMIISLFTIVPFTANAAEGVEYIYRTWDYDHYQFVEETRTCTKYTNLSTYAAGKDHTLTEGWYVAANVTFGQLTATGEVHIIVPDGVTMKCTKGILVIHKLNIYGQQNDAGTLDVKNSKHDCAAIGGSDLYDTGEINIYGSTVKAQSSDDAAGIGSGENHGYTAVNIYGGNVTAIGSSYGAGIGSGASGKFGTVRIYNGTVNATGGDRGAGIGGGNRCDGSHVYILGGTVNATGGKWGAGIGGGNKGLGGVLDIRGGTVTAKGGFGGAGVGGGDGACRLDITNVWSTALDFEASGGELTAIGGDEAAGIGGGNQEEERTDGAIEISGGDITAIGGANYGAGIGGGDQQKNSSPITITGGKVTAKGGVNAAGIGSGDKGSSRGITISGGEVIANGGKNGAGIGSGNGAACGAINISMEGTITAPDSTDGTVTATGGINGAGIGGGNASENVNVNIANDSVVIAYGGEKAAGIGGGNNANSFGHVTVSEGADAIVTAIGGKNGAGIGGGEKATSGSVTINGADDLQAVGGIGGAGIGKGSNTSSDNITVTINGGIVAATGGNGLFNEREGVSLNCAPGIGGSAFSGTINLTGGNITANGAHDDHYEQGTIHTINYGRGTAIGSNSSNPRTGTVNITAGAVIDTKIEGFEAAPSNHYYANAINFIDTEEGHSCVQYDSALAASGDRVKACGWKAEVIHIEPCRHGDFTCETKDSEHHKAVCPYCPYTDEEPHNDVLTAWTWGTGNESATATFTCKDCGNNVSVVATVNKGWGSDGDRYTATVNHNDTEYSTVRIVNTDDEIVSDGVVITFKNSDGSIIQSSVFALGDVPYCTISPRKPGADSSAYDLVGWSDDTDCYINSDQIPEARTQTVYTPVYKYRNQTEPYIDASGAYNPGKVKHYLINGKYYDFNEEDSSVGSVRDSVDISYFDFELLNDGTYRINKYTGPTENMTELVIPKSYKGKAVTVLGDDVRESKLFNGQSPQFTLVLNENIKKIGTYTFWGVKVAKVTGDTSSLKQLDVGSFSNVNTASDRTLDIQLDYPGMITAGADAFNGMNVTARVKHATSFNTPPSFLGASKLNYVFTDAHDFIQDWDWIEPEYISASLELKCSDSRCALNQPVRSDADITSKTTDNKIIYTATAEVFGETYTDTQERYFYKITTLDADHGKVETDVEHAFEDQQVNVTVTPDEGYHLSSVSAVKDTIVPLTYVMGGTNDGDETVEKLVDGNKFTMWSQRGNADIFLKADKAVRMKGYSLTTGNTVSDHPESNWLGWTIYGANFDSDSEMKEHAYDGELYWDKIDERTGSDLLQAENNTTYDFTPQVVLGDSQYYRITVIGQEGADCIQMSEFELKTEEENVAFSGEGFTMPAYPVIVSATFEPNTHTVTWLDEDGTELERDENVPYGSKPAFSGTTPTKTGFTFMGWKDGEDFYAPDELPEVTGDVTYTAVFGAGDGLGSVLAGHSISLEGDIAVNFYMELSDFVIAHKETAYMRFAVPGENGATEQKKYVRDAKIKKVGDKTYYAFKCRVAAKEMTSEIKARLIDGSKAGDEYTYSVKQYADYLLAHTSDSTDFANAAPLVKKMLNYGAYAQKYFDRNIDKLANEDLPEEDQALGDVTVTEPQTDVSLPAGVSFEGATLSLKSETTLSLYFTSDKPLTFSSGDKTVETASSGNYQIARIRGIPANELQRSFKLTITAGEATGSATYSPMNYCYKILNDGTYSKNLINVTKALVLYAQAANEYFSPTS